MKGILISLTTQFHFNLAADPLLRYAPYRKTLVVKILQKDPTSSICHISNNAGGQDPTKRPTSSICPISNNAHGQVPTKRPTSSICPIPNNAHGQAPTKHNRLIKLTTKAIQIIFIMFLRAFKTI